jgi:hypothetical protein
MFAPCQHDRKHSKGDNNSGKADNFTDGHGLAPFEAMMRQSHKLALTWIKSRLRMSADTPAVTTATLNVDLDQVWVANTRQNERRFE